MVYSDLGALNERVTVLEQTAIFGFASEFNLGGARTENSGQGFGVNFATFNINRNIKSIYLKDLYVSVAGLGSSEGLKVYADDELVYNVQSAPNLAHAVEINKYVSVIKIEYTHGWGSTNQYVCRGTVEIVL